jgi:hypothetical protein
VESVLTMAHDVFISHSHVDKPAADAACAVLEARGIRCWIAPRDIGPGQEWAASIIRAIREAKIMLLVFSRHANESSQVRREVERAAHSEKVLLPLRIDDVLPGETLEFFLSTPHWLDAITPPLEAHLEKLADTCTSLLAALDTDHGSATSEAARPPSPGPATPGRSFAAPAPALNPAGSTDPRAQIVQLTGSRSEQGFVDAIVDRDTSIVALYLKSDMKATTLHQGASAILFGFQGVPQNGDPVALLTTFQTNGFKVDDELEDSWLMKKLAKSFPLQFHTDLAPKDYTGGYWGGKFVGSLLFWIVHRALWSGPGTSPYEQLLPMMQNCAK